ncbi:uncharacterized protein ACLA_096010 [Aspergillus clavatus NRRL 1]|uniref:Uncharacterized protein n=1 Tax=Aspergillus clavatus (strain ATCC 1007 / CBS 513.65 / DSM 816 / NCTC 3887 / NRRL 1 / QM 1276 / 107) TaxID=344612 RepID=A1CM81_ASPCL|nr:uncharacterized protein ACLA_096010 [Aspergillus clavatus NRRL 1]EAW08668.1 conserved hypothetical protein [Aspergillus clavatus NRRL 1]
MPPMSSLAAPPPAFPHPTALVRTQKAPTPGDGEAQAPQDPNLTNPRLLLNGACIYERRLPGNACITAHVQRLQHGFYASPAVSEQDYDHVDFLGISFVFHSPKTLAHRFKAAIIRASVQGAPRAASPAHFPHGNPPDDAPCFLRHAPHLIYGTVSPETLQWNYSLSGSLGIAELPLMASLSPAGGINGRYRRYEMMRIQGSARTLRSPRAGGFDTDAGEIVWSLEENNLQRSGLPREFTFAMLIHKPRADSRVVFALEVEPTLQSWCGSYPAWWLSLPQYRPLRRRAVDFRAQVGQRFEPVTSHRGFNFATLASSFDDYVRMPGKRFVCSIAPDEALLQDVNDPQLIDRDHSHNHNHNHDSDYTTVKPHRGMPQLPYPAHTDHTETSADTAAAHTPATAQSAKTRAHTLRSKPSTSVPDPQPQAQSPHTLNVRVHLDSAPTTTRRRPPSASASKRAQAQGQAQARHNPGTSARDARGSFPSASSQSAATPRASLRRTRSREWLRGD